MTMPEFLAWMKKLTGTPKPWASLTYWGLALFLAGPDLLAYFGVDLTDASKSAGLILTLLGIRRRLPG